VARTSSAWLFHSLISSFDLLTLLGKSILSIFHRNSIGGLAGEIVFYLAYNLFKRS